MYRFDDFLADQETWRLTRGGEEIHLEPLVLQLLIYLIANRERLVTRQELMDTVWGDTVISESALTKAVARLRKALDDDSATHRYLETVRSRGYRFVAKVEEIERQDDIDSRSRRARTRGDSRHLFVGLSLIVALIVAGMLWSSRSNDGSRQADVIRSLAVLPLSNLTGDPDQDYYVDGLQDLLITELSQLPGLRVTSRQSTKRYRDSQRTTAEIAEELGVDALVEGSLLREGSKIEVTIQLIDGRSDEHIWAERYSRETPDIFSLISDMANAISAETGVAKAAPGVNSSTHGWIGQVDPRAVDAYALGVTQFDRFTRDGIRAGIDQFETAVAIEPEFALAWGQLGVAYAMQGYFGFAPPRENIEIARAAFLRAIEADPKMSIGHSGLGWVRWWTRDFEDACESFQEALRLNPSAPYAIHGDAHCLQFDGRTDESIARLHELVTISPFTAIDSLPLVNHLYLSRRFDEAITAAVAMKARGPQFSIHGFLAKVYWQQGLFDKALEEERLELEQRGDTVVLAALEEGLVAAGPTGAMRAMAEALVARSSETYVDPFDIAETFARAGMVDEAMHWLNRAIEYGSYELSNFAYWPHLDVLRDDPRYEDLLERIYGENAPKTGH